jgi:hypothetical protein
MGEIPLSKVPLRQGTIEVVAEPKPQVTAVSETPLVVMACVSGLASVTSPASSSVAPFVRPACVAITTFQMTLGEVGRTKICG